LIWKVTGLNLSFGDSLGGTWFSSFPTCKCLT